LSQVKIQENRKEESQILTLDALILKRSNVLRFLQCKLCAVEVCCIDKCKPLQEAKHSIVFVLKRGGKEK
jgi:hypothetical protein